MVIAALDACMLKKSKILVRVFPIATIAMFIHKNKTFDDF